MSQDPLATGNQLYQQGKFREAIDAYEEAIKENPSNVAAYYWLGWSYSKIERNESAEITFKRFLSLCPNSEASEHARKWLDAHKNQPSDVNAKDTEQFSAKMFQPIGETSIQTNAEEKQQHSNSKTIYCQRCGKDNPVFYKFCMKCGGAIKLFEPDRPKQQMVEKRFPALRTIAFVIKLIAWVEFFIPIIIFILTISVPGLIPKSPILYLALILMVIAAAIMSVLTYAGAESILVILAIEENTRRR